jgi:hypothetical protein|nr:MAG TPA: hypothetical protein [Caudoviricetes sp.]
MNEEKFEGSIGRIKYGPDRPHVQNEDISKIHFGRIRYITQSKSRRDAFRKLIKEKGLKTNDLTLILSSIGFNPEFYHFTVPEAKHTHYLYHEDAMGELADKGYE